MPEREIILLPDPVLRKKARKVTEFDKDLQTLIDDMIETVRSAPGVGLAAPQVNVLSRVIVVEYGDDEDEEAPKKLYALVNPEIIQASEETVKGPEACLSIPSLMGEVERNTQIVIKGFNRQGKTVKVKAKDWLARIFQHEIDHLDGILFVDRATRIWKPTEEEAAMSVD